MKLIILHSLFAILFGAWPEYKSIGDNMRENMLVVLCASKAKGFTNEEVNTIYIEGDFRGG